MKRIILVILLGIMLNGCKTGCKTVPTEKEEADILSWAVKNVLVFR